MCDLYQITKDFIGPLATFCATGVGLFLALRFTSVQAEAAKRQADIAHDKLKYDLFERRYRIYDAAKELIKCAINDHRKPDFRPSILIEYYTILEEAPFFFSADLCDLVTSIEKLVQEFLVADAMRNESGEGPQRSWELLRALESILKKMPSLFAHVLSFEQLTKKH